MNEHEFIEYFRETLKTIEIKLEEQMYVNWHTKKQLRNIVIELLARVCEIDEY